MTTKATKTKSFMVIVLSLAICPILYVDSGKTREPIAVNKCCRIGEQLDRNKECTFGSTDQWWPLIVMILKQSYYEPNGKAPPFFKIREHSQPICDSPELISSSHALFSNGTLYLSDRNKLIEKDDFCVDKGLALICDRFAFNEKLIMESLNRTKIRKCCPPNAIYELNAGCVSLNDRSTLNELKFFESPMNSLEYRYGFPQCSKNDQSIAIIGKFNESQFDGNSGNLTIAEGIFQSEQFCLEHVNDTTDSIKVHVFTCAENLLTTQKVNIRFLVKFIINFIISL